MIIHKTAVSIALAILTLVTLMAIVREGPMGMFTPFSASFWTWHYFIDLVIALGLVMVWMWHDCKDRGKSPLPWIGATFLTGSFAALVYLLLRRRNLPATIVDRNT